MVRKLQAGAVYQLKITLKGVKPPIWRRLLVNADIPLAELHEVFQVSMGWHDSHLHQFVVDGDYYGPPDPQGYADDMLDDAELSLCEALPKEGSKMLYEYDFGDGWEHQVVVEKILPFEKQVLPQCLAGKRACPPEDCGGPGGYAELLESLADKKHPNHRESLEWVGRDFDPESFSAADVNESLFGIEDEAPEFTLDFDEIEARLSSPMAKELEARLMGWPREALVKLVVTMGITLPPEEQELFLGFLQHAPVPPPPSNVQPLFLVPPPQPKKVQAPAASAPASPTTLEEMLAIAKDSKAIASLLESLYEGKTGLTGRHAAALELLCGAEEKALQRILKAPGLNWGAPEHPGTLMFPYLFLVASGAKQPPPNSIIEHFWKFLGTGYWKPLGASDLPHVGNPWNQYTVRLLARLKAAPPSPTLRKRCLEVAREVAAVRMASILGEGRKDWHDQAAGVILAWEEACGLAGLPERASELAEEARRKFPNLPEFFALLEAMRGQSAVLTGARRRKK